MKNHNTLDVGLYRASANIAQDGALTTSNLTAQDKGGMNGLNDRIVSVGTNVGLINTGVKLKTVLDTYSATATTHSYTVSEAQRLIVSLFRWDGVAANSGMYLVHMGSTGAAICPIKAATGATLAFDGNTKLNITVGTYTSVNIIRVGTTPI